MVVICRHLFTVLLCTWRDSWAPFTVATYTQRSVTYRDIGLCWWERQESLANAKLSARQQCVYEGPISKILRQMNARNTMLKNAFSCLQRCRWQYWSIFIRLTVVATVCGSQLMHWWAADMCLCRHQSTLVSCTDFSTQGRRCPCFYCRCPTAVIHHRAAGLCAVYVSDTRHRRRCRCYPQAAW